MKGRKKKGSSLPVHCTDSVHLTLPPPPLRRRRLLLSVPDDASGSTSISGRDTAEEHDHCRDHHHQQQQQQQCVTADRKEKEGEENQVGSDVEIEYEEEDHDDEQLGVEKGGVEAEGEEGRPKLADGYYEIEAVRKKRIRKGQAQYLIKWRGWPETANTWEPLENLMSISDVIDAFEESLRTRASRRRKRKSKSIHSQSKKKQQQQLQKQCSPVAATCNVPVSKVQIAEEPLPFPLLNNPSVSRENAVDTAKKVNENDAILASPGIDNNKEQIEMDLNLIELREATATSGNTMDKNSVNGQESRVSSGDALPNGFINANDVEPVQPGRSIGAKRRKSGYVKRFKKDSASSVTGNIEPLEITNFSDTCAADGRQVNDLACKSKSDEPKIISSVTEIIKAISYSASVSNNTQDVSITFRAKSSDGKEVMVDNRYLKANNPLLLIDFYEQRLRYGTMVPH